MNFNDFVFKINCCYLANNEIFKPTTMKLFLTLLLSSLTIIALCQPPKINYQGVARGSSGGVLVNQAISLRLSISTTPTTNTVFAEEHQETTNSEGIFNLIIGEGDSVLSSISNIDWGSSDHFIKVEMDTSGGTSWVHMGTMQLVSVPYALYAKDAKSTEEIQGSPINSIAPNEGDMLQFIGGQWVPVSTSGSDPNTLIYTVSTF